MKELEPYLEKMKEKDTIAYRALFRMKATVLFRLQEIHSALDLFKTLRNLISNDSELELANCDLSMGLIYQELGDLKTAFPLFENSLKIRKKTLPKNHIDLAASYNQLGIYYLKAQEPEKSIENLLKAVEIYMAAKNISGLATAYSNLGLAEKERKDYEKAETYMKKGIDLRLTLLYYLNQSKFSVLKKPYRKSFVVLLFFFSKSEIILF